MTTTTEKPRQLCACGNCDWRGRAADLNEIKRYHERVEEGEEEPAGECPNCGALAHETDEQPAPMPTPKPKRVRMVCGTCGGENVKADAYAKWDVIAQQWECVQTFDKGAYCDDCDGECSIDEEEIADDDATMQEAA